ncbi:MAG: GNAT family N-acetyltransferase [Deltaproteobacteria bacterium]|nr:GNAT family N-acetyltransferase [Deltaproteobacteria bacterium]NIS76713.1 GNAT family N-acetyltransferase [Deltaproteobacteria bacterium]
MKGKAKVRKMTVNDVAAVLSIDEKITGEPHEAQWESRILDHITSNPLGCLVAEVDGQVAGFIISDIRGWEFGIPKCGWIEIVGVDPDMRMRGVARALIDGLADFFKMNGVSDVKTMIDWNDGGLVSFFRALGFGRSEFIVLEKELGEG